MPTRPEEQGGKRPDRCVIVYSQRVREAYKDVPIVIGGIEASLRRIAHFDYWSEQVRRSVLRRCQGRPAGLRQWRAPDRRDRAIGSMPASRSRTLTDMRGTAFAAPHPARALDRDRFDAISMRPVRSRRRRPLRHGAEERRVGGAGAPGARRREIGAFHRRVPNAQRERSVIRLPSFEQVSADPVLYAHASRILHLESNPGNARALVQRHGDVDVWLNPPPIPLDHRRDGLGLRAAVSRAGRIPRTARRDFPAYHMIRFSVADPARLLRRLHLLLDHRARGPHHPEPLGGFGASARSRRSATACRASPA